MQHQYKDCLYNHMASEYGTTFIEEKQISIEN